MKKKLFTAIISVTLLTAGLAFAETTNLQDDDYTKFTTKGNFEYQQPPEFDEQNRPKCPPCENSANNNSDNTNCKRPMGPPPDFNNENSDGKPPRPPKCGSCNEEKFKGQPPKFDGINPPPKPPCETSNTTSTEN